MDNKRRAVKVLLAFFIILSVVAVIAYICLSRSNEIESIKNEMIQIAINNGLKDVSIEYLGKDSEYDFPFISVSSSNFDTLSPQEMFRVSDAFDDASTVVYVQSYMCNGDRYEVFSSTRSILKNGENIYDDFKNSDVYNSSNTRSSSSQNHDEVAVTDGLELGACWSLAMDTVKTKLKSPSSAKFPFSYNSDGVSITKSGNTYTVKAWVDADNSFGVCVRSNFTVTMEKSGYGSNAKFTSKSCIID